MLTDAVVLGAVVGAVVRGALLSSAARGAACAATAGVAAPARESTTAVLTSGAVTPRYATSLMDATSVASEAPSPTAVAG